MTRTPGRGFLRPAVRRISGSAASARGGVMARYTLIAVAVLAVLALAAWAVFRSPVPAIDLPTADRLSATADWWCEQSPDRTVPPDEWPPEVRQLRPEAVQVIPDGVYI